MNAASHIIFMPSLLLPRLKGWVQKKRELLYRSLRLIGSALHQPLSHSNDETLVRRLQQGDHDAFDALVRAHADNVVNLCYRYLGSYDDADDAAQEIFMKVHDRIEGFRFDSAFSTWLYRITVNHCLDIRKSAAWRERQNSISRDTEIVYVRPGHDDTPEIHYQQREREEIIQKALLELPEKERLCVILADMENKSYHQIADETGMKKGTVRSTLFRARKRLRTLLEGSL